jgi:hypothetical protein
MLGKFLYCLSVLLIAGTIVGVALAEEPAKKEKKGAKLLSGMSVVGNDEAPKSLVIVPWKSSQLGHSLDLSKLLDDGRQPVDRDVFLRELAYYQIRAGSR